jgi:hypothetical protein
LLYILVNVETGRAGLNRRTPCAPKANKRTKDRALVVLR